MHQNRTRKFRKSLWRSQFGRVPWKKGLSLIFDLEFTHASRSNSVSALGALWVGLAWYLVLQAPWRSKLAGYPGIGLSLIFDFLTSQGCRGTSLAALGSLFIGHIRYQMDPGGRNWQGTLELDFGFFSDLLTSQASRGCLPETGKPVYRGKLSFFHILPICFPLSAFWPPRRSADQRAS